MSGFYEVLTYTRAEWARVPKAYRHRDAAGRLFVLKMDPVTGATVLWPAEVVSNRRPSRAGADKSLDTPRPS
jgi:hypothetical protein